MGNEAQDCVLADHAWFMLVQMLYSAVVIIGLKHPGF